MDFFEYANLAQLFVYYDDAHWVSYLVGALAFAIVFIFEAVGLYVIGTREGYKNRWMAFVPFFNTYYVGVCGQKNRFMKLDTKKIALALAILEAALFIANVIDYTATELLLSQKCIYSVSDGVGYSYELVNVPVSLAWAGWCFTYLSTYILIWFELIYLFLFVVVLSSFFQTYSARRYFLFTITSVIFPIQGILIFAVRNNTGMNYAEYLRREQERNYRMYQQYQQMNQNPYSQNPYNQPPQNGYSNQGAPSSNPAPEDPFGDLSSTQKPEDPFDEFKN